MVARTMATTKSGHCNRQPCSFSLCREGQAQPRRCWFSGSSFDFLEGEERKNLTTVQKVYEFLVKQGLTRSDGIVALGGGVVGDLAGS